jgi:hypothetical protein
MLNVVKVRPVDFLDSLNCIGVLGCDLWGRRFAATTTTPTLSIWPFSRRTKTCSAGRSFARSGTSPLTASPHVKLARLRRPHSLMGGVDEFFVILRLRPGAADSDGVLGFKGRGYILAKRLARLLFGPGFFGGGQLKRPRLTARGRVHVVDVPRDERTSAKRWLGAERARRGGASRRRAARCFGLRSLAAHGSDGAHRVGVGCPATELREDRAATGERDSRVG